MKTLTYIILLLLTLNHIQKAEAHEGDSLQYFHGYILSYPENNPVAFAHIINYTRKWGVVSDTTGYFGIWGKAGDTLNISAIGFQYLDRFCLSKNHDSLLTIHLQHRAYEIPEASISYLGTYQQFEQKVIHLDLPKIEFNPQVEGIFKHVERAPLVGKPQISSPASLIYVLFSKEVKEMNKYLELEEKSETEHKVYEKLNEHIVQNITGLDLIESRKFIKYCNFKDIYIINTPNYTLYSKILEKYKEYKKSNQDSLLIE